MTFAAAPKFTPLCRDVPENTVLSHQERHTDYRLAELKIVFEDYSEK